MDVFQNCNARQKIIMWTLILETNELRNPVEEGNI